MKVVNTYKKLGRDQYSWTVSIKGTDEELAQIKYVTYLLHETFSTPRIVGTRESRKFARTLTGWGEFLLKAEATMKNGDVKHAKLWLDLGFKHTKNEKKKYTGKFK
jgi:transcription initiation factor IIF auxiliary subunit